MSRQTKFILAAVLSAVPMLTWVSPVRAEADAAKKYVQQANADFTASNIDSAKTNLQLAEAELDGVDPAAKDSISKDIAALRQKINDSQGSEQKAEILKQIEFKMKTAKEDINNSGFQEETADDITKYLAQADVKAALGDEAIAKYLKTLATYSKVNKAKVTERKLERLSSLVDEAENAWAEKQKVIEKPDDPGDRDSAVQDMQRSFEEMAPYFREIPADNAQVKALAAREKKLEAAFNVDFFKIKSDEVCKRLKDSWASYAEERDGWDKETTGPSFNDLLTHQSDAMSVVGAPKTVALVSRANYWIETWTEDETFRQMSKDDPAVKAVFDDIKSQRQQAHAKLIKFASTILDDAGKTPLNKDSRDRLQRFAEDDLRLALQGSDQQKPLQDRAMKLVGAFDQKAIGDAAARQKLYDALVAQGNKAWPAMAEKESAADGLDAVAAISKIDSVKGKSIRLKAAKNRMGWDFPPGNGYEFAVNIDGIAVAGKYDPAIRKAVNSIAAKTGVDFSNDEYDVIGVIDGLAPIVRTARAEGTLQTDSGEKVANITSERNETVTGIRMRIVAIHVGPVTASSSQGVVDDQGNIAPQN